ncbi:hypothetical protein EPUL_003042 [Erysiphe pulchra]|uniref:Uncharacterized protein n=1 Tax=Erysiphe pulchra TaxID=225359 RepID=A0A2S4Q0I4_9PEZI|nr:hypothetical protein EPUL_003042 [Erysiphe pulchra]
MALFVDYHNWIRIRKIRKVKEVWNMEEMGAIIDCPLAEKIIIPSSIGELCTCSLEDRTSVTMMEKINPAGGFVPPFFMVPGEKIMSNWALNSLDDDSQLTITPNGNLKFRD